MFTGQVTMRASKFVTSALKLQVIGKPTGVWMPYQSSEENSVIIQKDKWTRLSTAAHKNFLKEIAVVGTSTAISDLLSQLDNNMKRPDSHRVVVSDKSNLLRELRTLSRHYKALLITRGGDDDTMNIWDDREFVREVSDLDCLVYVGLGHTHRNPLMNQYADEAFPTPTALGQALCQSVKGCIEKGNLESKYIWALRRAEDVKKKAKRGRRVSGGIILMLILGISAAFGYGLRTGILMFVG